MEHAHLPNWPRLMKLKLAAAYLDVSIPVFKYSVHIKPVKQLGPTLYDKDDLDEFVNSLSADNDNDLVSALLEKPK